MSTMRTNGEAITALRERTGLTKTQLAKAAGIDRTHLHRIETGERQGTPSQVRSIAETLQVPITAITHPETGIAS
jgi:transcriptional regulator with XRE-family HTH domain